MLGLYEWQATPMWLDGIPEDFPTSCGMTISGGWIGRSKTPARACPRSHRRRPPRRQRADPVLAGRQPVYRPGARAANFFHCQHIQFRHLPGRRRWQSAGGVGRVRRAGMGSVAARSSRSPATRRKDLHGAKRSRCTRTSTRRRSERGAPGRTAAAHVSALRGLRAKGRAIRRARRLGAGNLVRRRGEADDSPSSCAQRPYSCVVRGSRCGARACRPARSAGLQQIHRQRARRAQS